MSKNGINIEKDFEKIIGEIQQQGFANAPRKNDKKSRSLDLVDVAYEQPEPLGKKLVEYALVLYPDNIDAYNYLGNIESNLNKAIILFEKAIKIGEKNPGKKFFEESKEHFWGIMETRPYMRAKAGLADCWMQKGKDDKAIEIYEEMMALNPNDNQGIRFILSTLLLKKKDLTKYRNFVENTAGVICDPWPYNNALYQFKISGQTETSDYALFEAYKNNIHIIDYILGIKSMPNELPMYIAIGSEYEAVSYVDGAFNAWIETDGALDWLREFKKTH